MYSRAPYSFQIAPAFAENCLYNSMFPAGTGTTNASTYLSLIIIWPLHQTSCVHDQYERVGRPTKNVSTWCFPTSIETFLRHRAQGSKTFIAAFPAECDRSRPG